MTRHLHWPGARPGKMLQLLIAAIGMLLMPLASTAQTPTASTPITGSSSTLSIASGYPSNSGATVVDSAITVYNSGSNYTSFKVSIASGAAAGDVLSYSAAALPGTVTGSYNSSTQILTFTGSASAAAYQALLRTVTINSTSAPATNKSVTFTVGNTVAFNGHYYEYVAAGSINWSTAYNAANGRTLYGLQGYLATVTSASENSFIATKLASDGWLGGSDSQVEGQWKWVTGPEANTYFTFSSSPGSYSVPTGAYANWNGGEPNNAGDEDFLEIYVASAGWNDLSGTATVGGFIVEYGGFNNDPVVTLYTTRNITYTCTAPVAFNVTGGGSYCTGGSAVPIGLSGSETGVNYQLYRGATAVGSVVAGTNSAISFTAQTTSGTYTVTAIRALGSCTTPMTGNAVVAANPTPTAVATPSSQTICTGTAITTIALSGSVSGATYNWAMGTNANLSGIAASGTGNISGSLTNSSSTAQTATFTITPTAAGCTGTPITATVTVKPAPTVNAVSDQALCNGSATTAITFSGTGTTYSWTNNTPSIGLAASGTGNIPAFTVTNTTTAPVTATISVTPTGSGTPACSGTPATFTITVSPPPAVYNVTGGGAYCSGGTGVAVGLGNSQTGYNYQLQLNGSNTGSVVGGTGAALTFPTQTAVGTYTVTAADAATGVCTATMSGSTTISTNPQPQGSLTANGPFCGTGSGQLTFTASAGTGPFTIVYNDGTANRTAASIANGTSFAPFTNPVTSTTAYTLVSVQDANCARSSGFTGGTATITVNPAPVVYNVTGGGAYCSGGTGVAVGLSNSQSGVNYQLLLNGSNTGSPVAGTGAAFSFPAQTATGTYTVLATQTAAGNCTAAMTGSASVTVYPLPSISVTNTVDPSCFGLSNGSISTTATGGTPGYSYAWTPAGPNSPNRTGLAAGSYSVIVTDVHNCTATTTAILSQPAVLAGGAITATFAVPSCPAYNIYLGYGAASDTMTTAASGGTGPYTYSWSPAVGTSILTSKRVVAPTATTTYTATIADAHGCIATAAYQVKVLNVHCGPAYIGRELNNTVNVCHSYQASPSNLCVSPSAVPGHLAHGDCLAPCGTASRGVGDGDGGGNENDYSGPATITVYPNPAQSTINVGLKGMGNVWKAYQIVDLSGRLVAQRQLEEALVQDVITVDISALVPGVYLIKVTGEGGINPITRFTVQ